MTLKGPADAGNYRIKVGRYNDRWYTDPQPADATWSATPDDEAYPSISTVKKASGKDWSFVSLGRVAAKLHGEALPTDYEEAYETLKSINKNGLKKAQDRGTGVHTIAEGRLTGFTDSMAKINPDAEKYRAAVDSFFDTYQPELVACEFVVIHRDLNGVGYGGTGDAVVCIEGRKYVVDWKSRGEDSDHGAYPEEGAQVAGYGRAQYWIVDVDGPKRIAPVDLDGGLIVSIKPDGFQVYPVDLDKGFEHWTRMHSWWCARRDERKAIGRPWARVATIVAGGEQAPDSSPVEPAPPGDVDVIDDVSDVNKSRRATLIARIKDLDDGQREEMARRWPDDVFTFKQSTGHCRADLDAIELVLGGIDLGGAVAVPDPPVITPTSLEPPAPAVLDEGDLIDDQTAEAIKVTITALEPDIYTQVTEWAKEAHVAQRGFSLSAPRNRTFRRFEIMRAAIGLAPYPDDVVRAALGFVMGVEMQPAFTVGQALGSLTISEASRLALLAESLGTTIAVIYRGDAPEFDGPGLAAVAA